MIFSAEMLKSYTRTATTVRHDGAVTLSITAQNPETKIISEIVITVSAATARELTNKLIKRLEHHL